MNFDWTMPNIKKFIEVLMDITLCKDIYELKGHSIHKYIWDKVAEKMCVNPRILRDFWFHRLHLQLFCSYPIYYNEIKIKLIQYIYEKNVVDKRDLNWPHISSYFDGTTHQFLYSRFVNLMEFAKQKTNSKLFEVQMRYLYKKHILNLSLRPDQILPRLLYKDGILTHNQTDLENLKEKR